MAEDLVLIVYLCLLVPAFFMLGILNRKSRTVFGYMLIGVTIGLLASQINPLLLSLTTKDYFYVTTNLTPVCEELLKAIPVLFFAFEVSRNVDDIISIAFAVGVGFAIFENATVLLQTGALNILWILGRGIGAGLMHGVCTALIGWGMSLVTVRKRLLLPGTFALLALSVIYHGIFNTLVQTEQTKYIGIFLPILTYIPIISANCKMKLQ